MLSTVFKGASLAVILQIQKTAVSPTDPLQSVLLELWLLPLKSLVSTNATHALYNKDKFDAAKIKDAS